MKITLDQKEALLWTDHPNPPVSFRRWKAALMDRCVIVIRSSWWRLHLTSDMVTSPLWSLYESNLTPDQWLTLTFAAHDGVCFKTWLKFVPCEVNNIGFRIKDAQDICVQHVWCWLLWRKPCAFQVGQVRVQTHLTTIWADYHFMTSQVVVRKAPWIRFNIYMFMCGCVCAHVWESLSMSVCVYIPLFSVP